MRKYKIVGICNNNALVIEICSNQRYALYHARRLLQDCETVTVYQGQRRIKTLMR